ncbi:ABC transporter ATP-binding protein [Planosporangium flavigriseum]|uniref:ABC-type quaternary amine transporter n=1 Tax=Planosporangium flavigriseum TaxID=373681 RepID=A0A8J3PNA3_9ACTN|nr:ABC transporter ATP-binding protein [Planosporangium flavigriseum]NJC65480.1 ABC transporter ATP-binding protein [Planosporangium flavigriseum]GIG76396.1 Fe(3+) ions import ATP-binding protein FbpC [Planosporangium flavigriseum]
MTALTIRQLTKSFGPVQALAGVDLDVPAESLTAVLGPSGCGKTTLLRMVAGFLSPDSGTIAFGDQQVAGPGGTVPPQRRRVGYVPQEGALFPHLDVAANVTFGLPRAARRARKRVDELLDLVELDRRVATRYPHELSGGQQQRVALARALAPQPSVVLLDEPFSSLDAALRLSTARAVAQALRTAHATAVLVTHDQDEALSLADQVAVMREGRLVQVGTPDTVYSSPTDPAVAEFVGAAVLLPGTVDGQRAECALGTLTVAPGSVQGPAQLVIRPEQIQLSRDGGNGGIVARVGEVAYFGHDATVRLHLEPGGPEVVARVMGARTPDPGARVRLSVDGVVAAYPSTN